MPRLFLLLLSLFFLGGGRGIFNSAEGLCLAQCSRVILGGARILYGVLGFKTWVGSMEGKPDVLFDFQSFYPCGVYVCVCVCACMCVLGPHLVAFKVNLAFVLGDGFPMVTVIPWSTGFKPKSLA